MLGALGNLGNILRQAQQMGGRMEALGDELRGKRVTGSAAGGMVEVDVNGLQEVLAVRIAPELFDKHDRELVEDLTRAAVNQAVGKARELHADAMKSMMGGVEMPGLNEALAKLTGPPPQD